MTTYILAAVDKLVPTFLRERFLAQELFTTVKVVGSRVLMLLQDAIQITITHIARLVHEAFLLSFRIVAVMNTFQFPATITTKVSSIGST
jgi:hypothetical protein